METKGRWWIRGVSSGALGLLWIVACAETTSPVGGESHFACKADEDCVDRPGNQLCFFSQPGSPSGECTDISAILDAAKRSAGGAGGRAGVGTGGKTSEPTEAGAGSGNQYCGASQRATQPDPPTGDPAPAKNVEIVAAQYTIDLGDQEPGATGPTHYLDIGFDLDNFCTLADAPTKGSCLLPDYALGVIDGKGGIDNAFGKLIQTLRVQISNFSSSNYSKSLQAGKSNVLLRLQNWNGEANDNEVTVSSLVAAPFDSFVPSEKPKWDGTDAWPVASDAVNGGSIANPKFIDKNAYVVNYQMVATLANQDLRLDVGLTTVQDVKLDLKLSAAYIVCTIVPVEEGKWGYTFSKCTLGGRWSANELVKQLGQFPNPLDNSRPLCRGSNAYEAFKKGICNQIDVPNSIGSPTSSCDSLSVGVTYTTKPALLGNVFLLKRIVDPCPPSPLQNPKYDCCESIDAPDGGELAACGFAGLDAGPPPSGTGGSGGIGGSPPIRDASTD